MNHEELHEAILNRIHDLWQEEYLTSLEFSQAYEEIKIQILEEDY